MDFNWFVLVICVLLKFIPVQLCNCNDTTLNQLAQRCDSLNGTLYNGHCYYASNVLQLTFNQSLTQCAISPNISNVISRLAVFPTETIFNAVVSTLNMPDDVTCRIGLRTKVNSTGSRDPRNYVWVQDAALTPLAPLTWVFPGFSCWPVSLVNNNQMTPKCVGIDSWQKPPRLMLIDCDNFWFPQVCELMCINDTFPCGNCSTNDTVDTTDCLPNKYSTNLIDPSFPIDSCQSELHCTLYCTNLFIFKGKCISLGGYMIDRKCYIKPVANNRTTWVSAEAECKRYGQNTFGLTGRLATFDQGANLTDFMRYFYLWGGGCALWSWIGLKSSCYCTKKASDFYWVNSNGQIDRYLDSSFQNAFGFAVVSTNETCVLLSRGMIFGIPVPVFQFSNCNDSSNPNWFPWTVCEMLCNDTTEAVPTSLPTCSSLMPGPAGNGTPGTCFPSTTSSTTTIATTTTSTSTIKTSTLTTSSLSSLSSSSSIITSSPSSSSLSSSTTTLPLVETTTALNVSKTKTSVLATTPDTTMVFMTVTTSPSLAPTLAMTTTQTGTLTSTTTSSLLSLSSSPLPVTTAILNMNTSKTASNALTTLDITTAISSPSLISTLALTKPITSTMVMSTSVTSLLSTTVAQSEFHTSSVPILPSTTEKFSPSFNTTLSSFQSEPFATLTPGNSTTVETTIILARTSTNGTTIVSTEKSTSAFILTTKPISSWVNSNVSNAFLNVVNGHTLSKTYAKHVTSASAVPEVSSQLSSNRQCLSSQWSAFSQCSQSCGYEATKSRHRFASSTCSVIEDVVSCELPACNPMSETAQLVAKVAQVLGCTWIIACCATSFGLSFFLRSFDPSRFIHGSQEVALMLAHTLIATARSETSKTILCTWVGIFIQYFFIVEFMCITLEAFQVFTWVAIIVTDREFLDFKLTSFIGWGLPAIVTVPSIFSFYHNYVSEFSCWLNLGHKLSFATIIPIGVCTCVSVILIESTYQTRLPNLDTLVNSASAQLNTARINQKSIVIKLALNIAAWYLGQLAVYYQRVSLFSTVSALNATLGISLLTFHISANSKAREFVTNRWKQLKKCFK